MTDYTKLVEALRCIADGLDCAYCTMKLNGGCKSCAVYDAADAIEALQAQMPKRGEWKTTRPDAPMFGFYYCSICGRKRTSPQDNYCPNCGAKMTEVRE
jgi:rubrerythrin